MDEVDTMSLNTAATGSSSLANTSRRSSRKPKPSAKNSKKAISSAVAYKKKKTGKKGKPETCESSQHWSNKTSTHLFPLSLFAADFDYVMEDGAYETDGTIDFVFRVCNRLTS